MFFDPVYLLFVAPALLLALWAQMRVKSTYAAAAQMPAPCREPLRRGTFWIRPGCTT